MNSLTGLTKFEYRPQRVIMNQRTIEDVAVPTSSPLTMPDRIGTNVVTTANAPANFVSGAIIATTSSSVTALRRGAASTYAITPETTFTEGPKPITVNAHPKQQHLRIQNSTTCSLGKSASESLVTPTSLRTFRSENASKRPGAGSSLPSCR